MVHEIWITAVKQSRPYGREDIFHMNRPNLSSWTWVDSVRGVNTFVQWMWEPFRPRRSRYQDMTRRKLIKGEYWRGAARRKENYARSGRRRTCTYTRRLLILSVRAHWDWRDITRMQEKSNNSVIRIVRSSSVIKLFSTHKPKPPTHAFDASVFFPFSSCTFLDCFGVLFFLQ